MAKQEEIAEVIRLMSGCCPAGMMQAIDDGKSGMGLILHHLYQAEGAVSIGRLSEEMSVTPPRITALVTKLEERGMARRTRARGDSRRVLVELTESGQAQVEKKKQEFCRSIEKLIDRVGLERLNTFFEISHEITAVLCEDGLHPPVLEEEKRK